MTIWATFSCRTIFVYSLMGLVMGFFSPFAPSAFANVALVWVPDHGKVQRGLHKRVHQRACEDYTAPDGSDTVPLLVLLAHSM